MALSSDLIKQFAKVTKSEKKTKSEATVSGTVVIYGNATYVKFDGSDLLTPVTITSEVKDGDRVNVLVKNHTATVTGNISSPSASKTTVDVISGNVSDLILENVQIKEKISANEAYISDLQADNLKINEALIAEQANIKKLETEKLNAEAADIKFATIDDLKATNLDVYNLKTIYGDFVVLVTDKFEAHDAVINSLDSNYANIDFSNIGKAAMEYFYANSGLIQDVTIGDATIAGKLVGVTISGDLIEGNTIVAEKLIVKGEDGLYYKLNTDGMKTEAEQTDYNSLNGQVIRAKSVTAEKIDVKDLVAFGATIGGLNISDGSIYSGTKESVDNTTRGFYLDKEGQLSLGDSNSFLKYYKGSDGKYRLEISAESLTFGTSNQSVEDAFDEVKKDIDTVRDYNVDAATEAAKTATNYMKFNNGLIIGDMTNSTLGNNVFIDSDSVDIRTGETILASYEGNKISLGKNSQDTIIDFCNGSMTLANRSVEIYDTRFEMVAEHYMYIEAPMGVFISTSYDNAVDSGASYIEMGSAEYDGSESAFIPTGYIHIRTDTNSGSRYAGIDLGEGTITLMSWGDGGEPYITITGSDGNISLSINPYITTAFGTFRPMLGTSLNGYYGLIHPTGDSTTWMRTTSQGLIPYASGGNSSSLGTSGWPFKNGYFKALYSDDIYLANGVSVYGKNKDGANVSMMGISSDNNLFIGAATEPQFDNTNIYAGSWIQLSANRTGDITSHVLQFFREQSSDKRTILRGATNGAIYLGTASFRYNTAFFTNAITASDLKEKEIIEDFDFKIEDFIMGLNPIAYRRNGENDTGRRIHMGFGAQDVSSLLKDIGIGNMSLVQACIVDEETVTKTDESGTEYTEVQKIERPYYGEEIDDSKLSWGLNYNEFVAPLVLFVQKQQREIEQLKARCENLEKGSVL